MKKLSVFFFLIGLIALILINAKRSTSVLSRPALASANQADAKDAKSRTGFSSDPAGAATGALFSKTVLQIENAWTGTRRQVSRDDYRVEKAATEERISTEASQDRAMGLNAEVQQREAQLLERSKELSPGLSSESAIRILGRPDAVRLIRGSNLSSVPVGISSSASAFFEQVAMPGPLQGSVYRYSPREGLVFDSRNGWGYHVLFVRLDAAGTVLDWEWDRQAVLMSGQLQEWLNPEEAFPRLGRQ